MKSFSDMTLQQLCEMNAKAQRLCKLMKLGIVEFVFKKKSTGKMRKARGTLKRDIIPEKFRRKRGHPRKWPEDVVIYYDVDRNDIRSFKDYLLQKFSKKPKLPKNKVNTDNENGDSSKEHNEEKQ